MLFYNIIDHLDGQSSLHGMMWRHTSASGHNRTTGTMITFPSKTIEKPAKYRKVESSDVGQQAMQDSGT